MILSIISAGLSDIKSVREIANITWNDTYKNLIPIEVQDKFLSIAYSDEMLAKRIKESLFLLAETENKVVGFINVKNKDATAELTAIYVLPEFQGKGIGTRLLNTALQNLDGVKEIIVDVEKGNLVGEDFYTSKGFKVVREYDEDFLGHDLKTIIMSKKVTDIS
jgi:ribosomal protein S18 acetylase RimI-like enzyme